MKVAAAQIKPFQQNTEANIKVHLKWIEEAAQEKVQLILFPEMSLTGYEREVAEELAFSENDERLDVLKEKAKTHQMTIIAGAPIKLDSGLHIGAFIFLPDGRQLVYTKQFLHAGEEKFFTPGFVCDPLLEIGDEKVSVAICADITNPVHPENAAQRKSTFYTAGIFYTPGGMSEAYKQLASYASLYEMNVLMANYVGRSYEMDAAGESACWNKKGELMNKLNLTEEGLLITDI